VIKDMHLYIIQLHLKDVCHVVEFKQLMQEFNLLQLVIYHVLCLQQNLMLIPQLGQLE